MGELRAYHSPPDEIHQELTGAPAGQKRRPGASPAASKGPTSRRAPDPPRVLLAGVLLVLGRRQGFLKTWQDVRIHLSDGLPEEVRSPLTSPHRSWSTPISPHLARSRPISLDLARSRPIWCR